MISDVVWSSPQVSICGVLVGRGVCFGAGVRVGENDETLKDELLYVVLLEGEDELNMLSQIMDKQTAPNKHSVKQPRLGINTTHSF